MYQIIQQSLKDHSCSLFFCNDSLGAMFIDCSSWNSSLQAYGIFSVATLVDDLQ